MTTVSSTMHQNHIWQRVIALKGRFPKKPALPAPVAPTPYILSIPTELLEEIIKHLDLHGEFMFSQTCQTARILTQKDWKDALLKLPDPDKLLFWARVAYRLPNQWACARCCKLHETDHWDTPRSQRLPRCQRGETLDTLDRCYKLRHTHVDLALKFRRMGVNTSYLREILAPCEYIANREAGSWKPGVPDKILHVPRVVRGRFCLKVVKEFHDLNSPYEIRTFKVCRHQLFPWWHWSFDYFGLFGQHVDQAWHQPGNVYDGYCKWCPMDYSVVREEGMLRMTFWYDYGTGKSARDLEWMIHVGDEVYNNAIELTTKYHEPGSIRELFHQGSLNHMVRGLTSMLIRHPRKFCRRARKVRAAHKAAEAAAR
ncbi:hypothetical protein CORC01_12660 [Colletotrichum orchidophilum]|uniref:F-box domain-containing protein n=1 Tax=Colletotrichum orchidophilum TaxID=1209926 RepID=A0A1G4ASD7_9PEZI|nr:uncharacterized protein CORC01_12660 [Colletotrichum orchidophilum]OHE92021.1 hypothetical protein CORC01_12660 [Colletotrichum orchidophilum]